MTDLSQESIESPKALPGQRFELGSIIVSQEVLQALQYFDVQLSELLAHHAAGNWTNYHPVDREINERALQTGGPVTSLFTLYRTLEAVDEHRILWVVTGAERMFTTLILRDATA